MIDQPAARLLMTIAETPGGKIAASVLDDFYPLQGKQLIQANLLAPQGVNGGVKVGHWAAQNQAG